MKHDVLISTAYLRPHVFLKSTGNQPFMSYLLVVASSGRMLAQAAKKLDYQVLVIDLFTDCDTQSYATEFIKLSSLAKDQLAMAWRVFSKKYPIHQAIYGSGLEYYPESLTFLTQHLQLLGNTPAVFTQLQNKVDFFAVLSALQIPFPTVSFKPPTPPENWLIKPQQGQGGLGVKHYRAQTVPATGDYWQRYQPGIAQSVLFLANTQHAQVIGFNTQWTTPLGNEQSFVFSGIINSSTLTPALMSLLHEILQKLVPAFELKGLNSMDFIQHGDAIYVLEINPRLPASMQLYDTPLLQQHIEACQGNLPSTPHQQTDFCGYQIVYAPQDGKIPKTMRWPKGCVDLPPTGVYYRKTQPICSMIARHNSPERVLWELKQRQQQLFNQLNLGSVLCHTPQASTPFLNP